MGESLSDSDKVRIILCPPERLNQLSDNERQYALALGRQIELLQVQARAAIEKATCNWQRVNRAIEIIRKTCVDRGMSEDGTVEGYEKAYVNIPCGIFGSESITIYGIRLSTLQAFLWDRKDFHGEKLDDEERKKFVLPGDVLAFDLEPADFRKGGYNNYINVKLLFAYMHYRAGDNIPLILLRDFLVMFQMSKDEQDKLLGILNESPSSQFMQADFLRGAIDQIINCDPNSQSCLKNNLEAKAALYLILEKIMDFQACDNNGIEKQGPVEVKIDEDGRMVLRWPSVKIDEDGRMVLRWPSVKIDPRKNKPPVYRELKFSIEDTLFLEKMAYGDLLGRGIISRKIHA